MKPTLRILTSIIGEAIAQMEGWYLTPEECKKRKIKFPPICVENNNPGNLVSWEGYTHNKGFAKFPNATTGWEKLYRQIEFGLQRDGKSLKKFINSYAPEGHGTNQSDVYLTHILKSLTTFNIPAKPTSTLNSLTS